MKKFIIPAILIVVISCKATKDTRMTPFAQAPVIIYRTTSDYYDKVPVTLNAARDRVISYPAPSDLVTEGKLALPVKLAKGYLFDRRGVGTNTAFTSYTYEQYVALDSPPSPVRLFEAVIDTDPFESIYNCGKAGEFHDPVKELNRMIRKGLKNCKSLQE